MTSNLYDNQFFESQKSGSYSSARKIVPILVDKINPQSVVDVGCGVGTWLRAFSEAGVTDVTGVDGDYVNQSQLQIPVRSFIPHDLATAIPRNRRFDLAMSLEVAEHLDKSHAVRFVDDLCALADIVFFSAAIPYQSGIGHVNEQWQSYWARIFADRGYAAFDVVRPRVWNCEDVALWYRQNSLIFANLDGLKRCPGIADNQPLVSVVHPAAYTTHADAATTDLRRIGVARILKSLPLLFWNSFYGRIRSLLGKK